MPANIILWDGPYRSRFLPFTFTRPVAGIRCGILTIQEKYQSYLETNVSFLTEEYLSTKFPSVIDDDNVVIYAAALPTESLCQALLQLQKGQSLWQKDVLLAARIDNEDVRSLRSGIDQISANTIKRQFDGDIRILDSIWDIFSLNDEELRKDFSLLTAGRQSTDLPPGSFFRSMENIFLEEGATVINASLNADSGPIYIGKNSEVMEGSMVRGPFALGEHSTLKLSAKIYGATTIGPECKVGGEVNNAVFFGYSNKAHDGFIGNAVIGEWCNIGADTNNSNLKNNYEEVKVWSYEKKGFSRTGLQFCGLFLGDHTKCGINTMFNTGTVAGVSANIFGGGFPRNFIPSFSWGGASGFSTYDLKKATDTAEKVMARRNLQFDETERKIFETVFEETAQYRNF